MKPLLRSLLLLAVLVILAGAGWYLVRTWLLTAPDFDRVGGTLLVYEFDETSQPPGSPGPEALPDALRQRLDQRGVLGVRIRLIGPKRVEIAIPNVSRGHAERVAEIRDLLAQAGHLEFRILANDRDEKLALELIERQLTDPRNKDALSALAVAGKPPPRGRHEDGEVFHINRGQFTYSWVEMSSGYLRDLGLDEAAEEGGEPGTIRKTAEEARREGKPFRLDRGLLCYSREVPEQRVRSLKDQNKKYEYFLLTREAERDPETGESKAVTGAYLERVSETTDTTGRPAIDFRLNEKGGDLFFELTSRNKPSRGDEDPFWRHLAILLDDQIISAPALNDPIRTEAWITGNFTRAEVQRIVALLRSGSLPVTLRPVPVQETTVPPGSSS